MAEEIVIFCWFNTSICSLYVSMGLCGKGGCISSPEKNTKCGSTKVGEINKMQHEEEDRTGTHWNPGVIKPEIWIDFHHTISSKCGACPDGDPGELCAGDPQKGVREVFEVLSELGLDIVVYTGYGTYIEDSLRAQREIQAWLIEHDLDKFISHIRVDKPTWFLFIDDRNVGHMNWKKTLEEIRRVYRRDILGAMVDK